MFALTKELSEEKLEALVQNFDHHSYDYRSNSIDILMHMQARGHLAHSPNYGGFWVATKAEDCLEVAKNAEVFSNWPAEVIPALEPTLMIPINVDPPILYDYRSILTPLFAPNKVRQHAAYVRELAEDMLGKLVARGEGDLKWEYALPLTGMVTLKLAGLNADEWDFYGRPLHDLVYSRKPMEERLKAMAVMLEHMRAEIRRLKDDPVPGSVIEHLHNVEMTGRKLRLDEIDSIILIMLGGGLDTTQALFSMISVYLGRNPERRRELIDNPDLLDNAIEEFLRVFPPTQGNSRRATQDITVAGQEIKAEEQIFLSYAAANRDPDEYENPHEIDFRRDNIRHLSFGVGPHRCLGSHLARLEARTMLEVLFEMAPDYQLVEEGVELADDIGTIAGFGRVQVKF
jgi:cytochrome P450